MSDDEVKEKTTNKTSQMEGLDLEDGNKNSSGLNLKYKPKRAYMGFIFFIILLCVILRYAASEMLDKLYSFDECKIIDAKLNAKCLGNQAVYRVTFAGVLFFLCMACLTCPRCDFHSGYWCVKVPIFLCGIVVSFFIPNPFFDQYAHVARVLSVFFIFLQVMILIDLAYDLHEYILDPTGEGADPDVAKSQQCKYLCLCAVCLLAVLVGAILLYVYFSSCSTNTTMITVCVLVPLCLTFLSLQNTCIDIDKGLLTPLVVWVYCLYMCWQAIWSSPDPVCNPYNNTGNKESLSGAIIGIVITCLSIAWASTSAAGSAPNLFRVSKSSDAEKSEQQLQEEHEVRGNTYYHLILAMGCFYIAMLLTNWGKVDGSSTVSSDSVSDTNMWVKFGSVLGVLVLYTWTLIAPVLCKNRDFSDSVNSFR